jgi:hypothetical protein
MKSTLRCQIPEVAFEKFCFAGSSYGQLICGCSRNCLVVDVFTGAKVLSPQLPFTNNTYLLHCGMLTTSLASPNSHLLVCAQPEQGGHCLLDWLIGSDSWSKLQLNLNDSVIVQIVEFNGQFIAMDNYYRLYTLSLAPQLGLHEIATVLWDDMDECPFIQPWLLVCSGMLLIVDYLSLSTSRAPVNYKAYRLDMSAEPATWVEVVKLENDALFIGGDARSPSFSCMSPGRWGGRSNCLYCTMPITVNPGSCMGWVMMQMPFGMIPLTLTFCTARSGPSTLSHSGCTRACST